MLESGERQVQPDVNDIRRDHVARYEFVASRERGEIILDAACGIGYGSKIMFDADNIVYGVDRDKETIEYAEANYHGPDYLTESLSNGLELNTIDVAVCFETVEHIEDPKPLLKSLHSCRRLYASVPNDDVLPYHEGIAFHYRHYTETQFKELLNLCGWQVDEWFTQAGPESEVEPGADGRTIIAVCSRMDLPDTVNIFQEVKTKEAPDTVAILGLGPSLSQFVDVSIRSGGARELCDEVWGINALGDVIACDRVFHMDDVRIQEIRAEANPESNIANMLKWLKTYKGPIYTSRPHHDYPGTIGLPIEAMINDLTFDYFNSTAAWAVAYAIYIGVKKIRLFGCDFTYANAHNAEKGRACVEFWLGVASARGIKISLPKTTSIMDACELAQNRLYGYDTVHVDINRGDEKINCSFIERPFLPTAEEIEAKYDHTKHPSPLINSEVKDES